MGSNALDRLREEVRDHTLTLAVVRYRDGHPVAAFGYEEGDTPPPNDANPDEGEEDFVVAVLCVLESKADYDNMLGGCEE